MDGNPKPIVISSLACSRLRFIYAQLKPKPISKIPIPEPSILGGGKFIFRFKLFIKYNK